MNDYIELYSIGSRFPSTLMYFDGTIIDLNYNYFECDPFDLKEITYE